MKRLNRFFLPPLLLLVAPFAISEAQAGVWLQGSFTFTQETLSSTGSPETTDTRLLTSSTAGYAFSQGFLVGIQGLTARSTQVDFARYAWGLKGGLLIKGFELTAAYLPVARESGPDGKLEGAGFALNLGYSHRVAGPIRVGLQLTYWVSVFSKRDGAELTLKPRVVNLAPLVVLGAEF